MYVTTGVEDTNGNNLAQEFTSSFTTEASSGSNSPVITSAATFSVAENQTAVGTVTATDADDDTLTYSLSGADAASFSISASGVITFNTAPDYETKTSYSISVSVSDGTNTTSQAITINVTDVDEGGADTDGDGVTDDDDAFPLDATESVDTDGDGIGNNADTDDDGDGIPDTEDPFPLDANATTPTPSFTYGTDDKPIPGVKVTQTESDGTVTVYASNATGQVTLTTTTNTYTLAASLAETGTDPISVQDALYILQHIVELRTLNTNQIKAADINGDGNLTIQDALKVLQHNVELITLEPSLSFYDKNTGNALSTITFSSGDTPSITVIRQGDANLSFDPDSITDHAPILTGKITLTMDENEVDISTLVATDADNDTLTYSITGGADKDLFAINASTGALSFITGPDYEDPGDNGFDNLYDVEITVSDGNNNTVQALVIAVADLNEKLGITNKTINENEAGATVGDLSIIDTDFGNTNITYALSGDDAEYFILEGTTIKLKSTVSADRETKSRYTLTVTATNAAGETITEKVVVKIANVNETPILITALADQSNDEDSAFSFTVPSSTFTDVDGDILSYSATLSSGQNLPTWLSFNGTTRTFTGTPLNGDVGAINVTVTASDGSFSATDTFALTVVNTNDDPTAVSLSANAFDENADGAIIGDLSTTDDDNIHGDTHTYTLSGTDATSFEVVNGQLKLKAGVSANYEVKDSYTITVTTLDTGESTTSQSFTLTVVNTNDTPTAIIISSLGVPEKTDGAIVGTLSTTDEDGEDTHTYTVSDRRFEVVDGQLKLKAGNTVEYSSESTITIIVTTTDGSGATFNQEFILRVGSIQITATSFEENTAGAVVGDLSITDPDFTDNVTYELSGTDEESFEIVNNNQVKMKDSVSADFETKNSYSITITATDDASHEASLTYSLQVIDVNEAPTLVTLSAMAIDENSAGAVIGDLTTSDVDDGDTHTYTVSGLDAASFEVVNGELKLKDSVTADYETQDSYSVTITTTDSGELFTSETFTITVNDTNDAPTAIALSAKEIDENSAGAIVGSLTTTDDDAGDSHTYAFSGSDANSFEVINDQLKLRDSISANYEVKNTYSFDVISNDSDRLSTSQSFTITVNDVNDLPVMTLTDTVSLPENQTAVDQVIATDEDDDPLTYELSGTDESSLSIDTSGVITFISAPDYETKTRYSVTVTVSDGKSQANQALTINITNVNDVSPVISSLSTFNADENQTAVGTVIASDVEGDTLIYELSGTDASALSISPSGVMTFSTVPNYENKSSYSLTVLVNDGANPVSQDLVININDINDIPLIFSNSTFSAAENQTTVGTVVAEDEDGDTLDVHPQRHR